MFSAPHLVELLVELHFTVPLMLAYSVAVGLLHPREWISVGILRAEGPMLSVGYVQNLISAKVGIIVHARPNVFGMFITNPFAGVASMSITRVSVRIVYDGVSSSTALVLMYSDAFNVALRAGGKYMRVVPPACHTSPPPLLSTNSGPCPPVTNGTK